MSRRLPPSQRPERNGSFEIDDVLRLCGEMIEAAFIDASSRGYPDPLIVVGNFGEGKPRGVQVIQSDRYALDRANGKLGLR